MEFTFGSSSVVDGSEGGTSVGSPDVSVVSVPSAPRSLVGVESWAVTPAFGAKNRQLWSSIFVVVLICFISRAFSPVIKKGPYCQEQRNCK